MPFLFFISIVYFLFVSFISRLTDLQSSYPFFSYYQIQVKFISANRGVFFLGSLFIIFLYSIGQRKNAHAKLAANLKRIIVIFVTGSLVTFLLLYVIAFAEVNIFSLASYGGSGILGVQSNSQIIVEHLKNQSIPPIIIAGENNRNILPVTVAIANAGKDSFYAGKIIRSIPLNVIFPAKRIDSGVLEVGNTLIITNINSSDFQNVSPVIGFMMVKRYFPKIIIKHYPRVNLMTEDEYRSFRKEDFTKKLGKFDEVISQIQKDGQTLSDSVKDLNDRIGENTIALVNNSRQKEKEYSKCINAGNYKSGTFYKTNTESFCHSEVAAYDDKISELKKEGNDLNSELQNTLVKIEQYKVYEKYYADQKLLTKEASSYISYEFGTFEPPDKIKISLALKNNSQAVADYLELVVHEYLHYTRYEENGTKIASAFFDEGLTEYFARRIVKESLRADTNLGYPVNVKIIEQITKRIADSDLATAYFANDQPALEKLLDRVYGTNFYKQNEVIFESLHYSSDKDQILNIGNNLMTEIGGTPLSAEDLVTTYSTFK